MLLPRKQRSTLITKIPNTDRNSDTYIDSLAIVVADALTSAMAGRACLLGGRLFMAHAGCCHIRLRRTTSFNEG